MKSPFKVMKRAEADRKANQGRWYMGGQQKTWQDEHREENADDVSKTFRRIIILCIILLLLVIGSFVAAALATTSQQEQVITASDTFAVSQREQSQMMESAQEFAKGMLIYAYCSNQDTALQGKNLALSKMATGTDAYTQVQEMDANDPLVAPENLVPVATEPVMDSGTQAYAGSYVYSLDGGVADSSVTDDDNPDGTFVDAGYHFELKFDLATDETTNEDVWVISDAIITSR